MMEGWTYRCVGGQTGRQIVNGQMGRQLDRLADRQQAPDCWWRKGGGTDRWLDRWTNVDRNLDCIESGIENQEY